MAMATATAADLKATLSLKDIQQCFEKERVAFIRDLESLRQQLLKKDQTAQKAAAVASQHAIQLKKEIASLQAALAASENDSTKYQEQFRHTSSLLESALDQHQADQAKLTELSETVRTMERKHEDTLALVRKEAAANVANTHEERKALRNRVDQLRCKLESERKEWQCVKKPMGDDLEKARLKLQLVEKELHESRYREQASVQLKDKAQSETLQYKRKVTDLSTALQEALQAKSEMKADNQQTVRKMKEKWREILHSLQQAKEQLVMLQEDYNGLYRSRQLVADQNDRVVQSMRVMKARHDQAMKEKEEEYWDLEKRYKRNSATCSVCMKTPEQRQEEMELKMDAVREQTRLAVAKDMALERWDRYQDVNAKYMDVCRQLQTTMRDADHLQKELKNLREKHDELQAQEKKLVDMLSRAEKRVHELERKQVEETQRAEDNKHQMQELMENLSRMTTLTSDQSKQLQELELSRRQEVDKLKTGIKQLEADKQQLTVEIADLQQQLEQQAAEFDHVKDEKSKQWNEIVAAQLSANLLIEEQAHTIDNLLKSRYNSPSKAKAAGSPRRGERQVSDVSLSSSSEATTSTPNSEAVRTRAEDSATVMVLRRECEKLRDELTKYKQSSHVEREQLQCEYEKKVVELMQEVTALQRERSRLKRKLEEQALTIHELTLQEDDEEEEEEVEEEEHQGDSDELDISDDEDVMLRHRVVPVDGRRQSATQRRTSGATYSNHQSLPIASTSRIRGRSSINFKNMSHDLSMIQPTSDDETTVGVSFLSAT